MKRNSLLQFSKKELNGIVFLFLIICLTFGLPYGYRFFDPEEVYDLNKFRNEIEAFKAGAIKIRDGYASSERRQGKLVQAHHYFTFDPNKLPESEWKQLGLSLRQIKVIKNYEAKGGKFFRKEDLKKIYSISEVQYRNLEPYIKIKRDSTRWDRVRKPEFGQENRVPLAKALIEINSADSLTLVQIRGVGPVIANRIIRFRNRLGGFYDRQQLKEVYGIDSIRYVQLQDQVFVNSSLVRILRINEATFDQLKNHPYLSFKQINAVLQYRKNHGNFNSIADLKKVLILDEEIIRKIEPYLSFDL